MILHTVNKGGACLHRCMDIAADESAILLLEDGVYAALDIPENLKRLHDLPATIRLLALDSDLAARGISDKMLPRFEVVSRQQFVHLCLEYDKVVSWG
jgi:tRNA 2-thiouridine synthesizing protein B